MRYFILFLFSILFANDVAIYKKYILPDFIMTTDDEIKRVINENRKMADKFRKEHNINQETDKIVLDYFYSRLYIKEKIKHFKVDDKVIKAYYLRHQDKFDKATYCSYKIFEFDTEKSSKQFLKNHQGFVYEYDYELVRFENIPSNIKFVISSLKNGSYSNILHFGNKYYIVYKNWCKKGKDLDFKEIKKIVKPILIDIKKREIIEKISK